MALMDVSNDPAHARGAKAAGFSIPGLTKPALVAEKPAAKASKASKASKAADGAARVTRKRAPGAKKAAALTTTPPPAASRAKMTAKENVSFAEAPADPKTPREPKTPRAPAVGFGASSLAAEDVTQQFKTPGNVTFAAQDVEEDEEGHADDQGDDGGAACKRVSRRQHARPERFGEFKSWNSVQKGTLGTPGHGLLSKQAKLRLGGRDEAEGSGTSTSSGGSSAGGSGKGGAESAEVKAKLAAQAVAAATPTTARFNAAASDAAAREVRERVEALMRMADEVLPVEDPAAAEAAANEKSLREQLSDSWNGQGYYAKLMTQMATPKKEGEKKEEDERPGEATGKATGNAADTVVSKKPPAVSATQAAPKTHPSAAAAPPAVSGSGGAGVAKKLGGGALASRATANAGWMLAGVVGASKPDSPAFGAASESGEALEAIKAELAQARAELAAAKEQAETLRSDAALAESEAESLGNTLESQTHQLRSKDAENKALKAELAQIKAKAAATATAMADAIKQAVDAAVAKCVAEM